MSLCNGGSPVVLIGAWNLVLGRRVVCPGWDVWVAAEIHTGTSDLR